MCLFKNKETFSFYDTLWRMPHTRINLNALDFIGNTISKLVPPLLSAAGPENSFCGPCIGLSNNENLSAPQKELLKWH